MNNLLEICCYSIESVINAETGGADRIELCDNIYEGGTTPSFGLITKAVDISNIDINIIIRPRGGNFFYSKDEFEIMIKDIEVAKSLKINGIVSGILSRAGEIDIERTKILVEASSPLPFTFHRAFDFCNDPIRSMNEIIKIGAKKILTSGKANTALEGVQLIKKLISHANENISIMPGGGITESNISLIKEKTGACEFHSSGKKIKENNLKNPEEITTIGLNESSQDNIYIVDTEKVKQMKTLLI